MTSKPVEVQVDGVIMGSLKLGTRYDEKAEQVYTKITFEAVLDTAEIAAIAQMSRAAESMTITFRGSYGTHHKRPATTPV